MNWKNLKDGLCPQCDKEMHYNPAAYMLVCYCGFKISKAKLETITSSQAQYTPKSYGASSLPDEPNREGLNGL